MTKNSVFFSNNFFLFFLLKKILDSIDLNFSNGLNVKIWLKNEGQDRFLVK